MSGHPAAVVVVQGVGVFHRVCDGVLHSVYSVVTILVHPVWWCMRGGGNNVVDVIPTLALGASCGLAGCSASSCSSTSRKRRCSVARNVLCVGEYGFVNASSEYHVCALVLCSLPVCNDAHCYARVSANVLAIGMAFVMAFVSSNVFAQARSSRVIILYFLLLHHLGKAVK